MKSISKSFYLFIFGLSAFVVTSCGGSGDEQNLSPELNFMMYSACCFDGQPVASDSPTFHALFEEPGTPTLTLDETQDLSLINNYDVMYVLQDDIDTFSDVNMATVRNWVAEGGILVILPDGPSGDSTFGSFLGATYSFTSIGELDGDTVVVTDPNHKILNFPNILDAADLSNWGSSTHGAFEAVGSAYNCVANDTDGANEVISLCAASYQAGQIILSAFDPECDCHDDHLDGGTNSAAELLENYIMIRQ